MDLECWLLLVSRIYSGIAARVSFQATDFHSIYSERNYKFDHFMLLIVVLRGYINSYTTILKRFDFSPLVVSEGIFVSW